MGHLFEGTGTTGLHAPSLKKADFGGMNHLEDRIREVVSFMHDATAQGPLTSDADVSARGISDQILDDVSAVVNYLKENHEDVRRGYWGI